MAAGIPCPLTSSAHVSGLHLTELNSRTSVSWQETL